MDFPSSCWTSICPSSDSKIPPFDFHKCMKGQPSNWPLLTHVPTKGCRKKKGPTVHTCSPAFAVQLFWVEFLVERLQFPFIRILRLCLRNALADRLLGFVVAPALWFLGHDGHHTVHKWNNQCQTGPTQNWFRYVPTQPSSKNITHLITTVDNSWLFAAPRFQRVELVLVLRIKLVLIVGVTSEVSHHGLQLAILVTLADLLLTFLVWIVALLCRHARSLLANISF